MPKRADANQPEIVKAFRAIGYSVQHLHTVGKGCPDILVGKFGWNFLIEIKDGDKPPSGKKLTPDEKQWHEDWLGQVAVIESKKDVLKFHVEKLGEKCEQKRKIEI